MTANQIAKAAQAFQDAISDSYWEEHGISDEEAATGMLAAMQSLGFCDNLSAKKILDLWKRRERKETRQRVAREAKRRAALTPEQRETEDLIARNMKATSDMLLARIADDVFQSSPFLKIMLGKT